MIDLDVKVGIILITKNVFLPYLYSFDNCFVI